MHDTPTTQPCPACIAVQLQSCCRPLSRRSHAPLSPLPRSFWHLPLRLTTNIVELLDGRRDGASGVELEVFDVQEQGRVGVLGRVVRALEPVGHLHVEKVPCQEAEGHAPRTRLIEEVDRVQHLQRSRRLRGRLAAVAQRLRESVGCERMHSTCDGGMTTLIISKSFFRPWPTKRQPPSMSCLSLRYAPFIVVMWWPEAQPSRGQVLGWRPRDGRVAAAWWPRWRPRGGRVGGRVAGAARRMRSRVRQLRGGLGFSIVARRTRNRRVEVSRRYAREASEVVGHGLCLLDVRVDEGNATHGAVATQTRDACEGQARGLDDDVLTIRPSASHLLTDRNELGVDGHQLRRSKVRGGGGGVDRDGR